MFYIWFLFIYLRIGVLKFNVVRGYNRIPFTGILAKMKEGAENVHTKLQAKVESAGLKPTTLDGKGIRSRDKSPLSRLSHVVHWIFMFFCWLIISSMFIMQKIISVFCYY